MSTTPTQVQGTTTTQGQGGPDPQGQGGGDGGPGGGPGGGGGGGPPIPPVPAVPPGQGNLPFALTPSQATAGALDYTDSAHVKLYKAASYQLAHEFDLTSENLKLFLENFKQRAFVSNWTGMMLVTKNNGTQVNLIENYGNLSLHEIYNHASTYLYDASRQAQNSVMILECLSSMKP